MDIEKGGKVLGSRENDKIPLKKETGHGVNDKKNLKGGGFF